MRWWNDNGSNGVVYRPVLNDLGANGSPKQITGTSLWVKNTSPYPQERIELLLSFAFAEVINYGIEIHLKGSSSIYKGRAYNGIPHMANVFDSAKYLVTIGLARTRSLLPTHVNPGTKQQQKLYPDGIKVRGWEDILIYVAAHEARHIWQFKARIESGSQPISEIDANDYAILKLSNWVVKTGGEPIVPAG